MTEEFSEFESFGFDDFSSDEGNLDTLSPEGQSSPAGDLEGDLSLPNGAILAVVDADQAVRDYLAEQLGGGITTIQSLAELETRFGNGPIVAVLGPSCIDPTDLAAVERWSRSNPEVGTILVTSELSTTLLHTALRAGVKDVLSAPIDQIQLVDTVSRVAEGLTVAPSPVPAPATPGGPDPLVELEGDPGRVITIFSTKGGSGKSVTATNVAVALAKSSNDPVVLIDGHLQFGDVAVMLKLQPQHTVADAVSQIDKLDPGMLHSLLTVHEASGLLVLPAPLEPTFADQITGEQMVRLVEILKGMAGHVVIDLPSFFNDVVLSILEASDEIVLVAGLDIPNIKNIKIGLSTLSLLNIPREQLHVVLNRADSKVKLDVGEVEKTLQITAVAHVPSDVAVPISVNKGVPVVLSAPNKDVARAFEQLAARFMVGAEVRAESASGRRRFFGG
ncbi:MAG: pilus assembly protein CpaE [Acidimicrobiales bacterium]|jgi:pilus assembly protein CpaE